MISDKFERFRILYFDLRLGIFLMFLAFCWFSASFSYKKTCMSSHACHLLKKESFLYYIGKYDFKTRQKFNSFFLISPLVSPLFAFASKYHLFVTLYTSTPWVDFNVLGDKVTFQTTVNTHIRIYISRIGS